MGKITTLLLLLLLSFPALALQPLQRLNVVDDLTATLQRNFENLEYERKKISKNIEFIERNAIQINNLKLATNPANTLQITAKSSGSLPNNANPIEIAINDGAGTVLRSRVSSYKGGTSSITLADGAGYWGRPSASPRYNAYLYAIWDGSGIVWALSMNSFYLNVEPTTDATALNYFKIEDNSTYIRNAADNCVCVGMIEYSYTTTNNPDHNIVVKKILYRPTDFVVNHHNAVLGTTIGGTPIADRAILTQQVLWTGTYQIFANMNYYSVGPSVTITLDIRRGTTYAGGAVLMHSEEGYSGGERRNIFKSLFYDLVAGDTVYMGASVSNGAAGQAYIFGNSDANAETATSFAMILLDRYYGLWY